MQGQEGENRIVAKLKPTMNLVSLVSTSFSTVQSPIASKSPGILKAPCRTDWSRTWKLDAEEKQSRRSVVFKLVASGNSGNSGTEGSKKAWPHNLHISTNYVLHMEKVFSTVRQRYGLSPTDQMKNLDVNAADGFFMSVTLQAAVHLGKEYTEKLRSTNNQPMTSLRQLFQVTERLITDQTEITGLTTIDWQQAMWRETTLLTDRAVQFATAKTSVFADSVLCVGGYQY